MVMECPGYSNEFDPTKMFERILVPIDFSPESRRALITACEIRGRFGSEVHIFLMRSSGENDGFLGGLGNPDSRASIEEGARKHLQYFAESICSGTPCLYDDVLFGDDVAKGIATAAAECQATMVFLAVHEHHSWLRTRAEKITNALPIPVLLLKGSASAQGGPAQEEQRANG